MSKQKYTIGQIKGALKQMGTQTLYLWLLECREGNLGRIFTLYARDQVEAENQVKEYCSLHPELSRVSLSEKPDGFIFFNFRRPGRIVCKE